MRKGMSRTRNARANLLRFNAANARKRQRTAYDRRQYDGCGEAAVVEG